MSPPAKSRPWTALLVASVLSALACSSTTSTVVGPQNSHIITSGRGMSACAIQARKICGSDGYTVLEGVSRSKLLGGSSSSYRAASEIAQLTVRCGLPPDGGGEQPPDAAKLSESTGRPPEPAPPKIVQPDSVCTPGSTLACFGPGACQGGQTCLESGRGFGPCDCGPPESNPES